MKHSYAIALSLLIAACGSQEQPTEQQSTAAEKPKTAPLKTFAWEELTPQNEAHLRGLHVVSDSVVWASGSGATVMRTIDGGTTWNVKRISETEQLDFRDVEAFDDRNAIVVSSGTGVQIYYTNDGGTSWTLSYEDKNPQVFFDGLDCQDGQCIAYGDPMNGKFQLLSSMDSGKTWEPLHIPSLPEVSPGEASFAASGTAIHYGHDGHIRIGTGGGRQARVFDIPPAPKDVKLIYAPLHSSPPSGIFSLCMWDEKHGAMVGGSYVDTTRADSNAAYTVNGGKTWLPSKVTPAGYRSCLAATDDGSLLIATGRAGTDFSMDGGKTWQVIGNKGYYACGIGERTVWGVGKFGSMGIMRLTSEP